MTEPDEFDQFYKDVRTRLLLLTYCLTGDLPSSRAAVRDAFVVAWHHWRKVSRAHDPEAWVREHACRHAQRRHTAKLWHREKGLDPEVRTTLEALGRLSLTQRRVLLVTELTSASLTEMAREVGLPRTEAERELQLATSQFALHRDVPTTQVRAVLQAVQAHVATVSWPRPTILRRAGATRRRTHTVIGVAGIAAALVVTGTVVSRGDGVRPTLSGERVEAAVSAPKAEKVALPETAMLTAEDVGAAVPGPTWAVAGTDDHSTGDEAAAPCQQSRYASPRPVAALVRTYTASAPAGATAVQATEASPDERVAQRAYVRAVRWFAGCADDRVQLMSTNTVAGVGDQARVLVLRDWTRGRRSAIVAGVARTGRFTTVVVSRADERRRDVERAARLLGQGVTGLCDLDGAGACTTTPTATPTRPMRVSDAPGMLGVVDLPPVDDVQRPWVATPAKPARTNVAATQCDATTFTGTYAGKPVTRATTRSYLVLGAGLPAEFGLTETVGALPPAAARTFVAQVRKKMDRCEDKEFGTKVRRLSDVDDQGVDLTIWHVTIELSDKRSMTTSMAVLRSGTSVGQLSFIPARGATMSDERFAALARRALERLPEIPAPTS